jgi:hypothetical protein
MAVVNTLSTSISNIVAKPYVANDVAAYGGYVRSYVETVEVAAADDDTSTYRLVSVPSNMRVRSVAIYNDAIVGGTSYDIGLYYNSSKLAGVVVPACVALFGSAIDLSSAHASTGPLNVTYEATATNIDAIKKPLWQLAGLATDPGCYFDIVATANTVGTGAGTISMDVSGVVAG